MKSDISKILILILCWMAANVPAQTGPGPAPALEYYKAALSMHRAGKFPEAIEGFKKSLELERTVRTLVALGLSFVESGQLTEAMDAADEALELSPDDPEVYILLGALHDKEEAYDRAADAYKTALRLRPDLFLANSRLGSSLVRAGRAREGVKPLERAAIIKPGDAIVQNDLGCAYSLIHRYAKAISSFNRAIELDPGFNLARFNLAEALQETGDRKFAIEQYAILKSQDPELAARLFAKLFGGKIVSVKQP